MPSGEIIRLTLRRRPRRQLTVDQLTALEDLGLMVLPQTTTRRPPGCGYVRMTLDALDETDQPVVALLGLPEGADPRGTTLAALAAIAATGLPKPWDWSVRYAGPGEITEFAPLAVALTDPAWTLKDWDEEDGLAVSRRPLPCDASP